ncbi:hypothetical protein [Oceanobacillus profundus]|uniref:zinc ribbon domain-containing protein n=1 Tax=Oceanobacillus TaxID=182709 RepID=UPI0026E1ED13|nr:hypothetical protein [Oceanobacillus profundus]MDO6448223.1 hypothetical protein [Oceanobacillus profundus]
MKCPNCGHNLSGVKKFCPECGSNVSEQKAPRNKKIFLVIGAIVGVLFIAVISLYVVGNKSFGTEQSISAFEDAVANEDTAKLKSLLVPAVESFEITDENTSAFINYLNSNPESLDELISKFHSQAEFINQTDGNNGTAYMDDVYATLNLIHDGKAWALFDDYKFEVIPAMITLAAENENITLSINEEEVATTTEETFEESFGPFMPGVYSVQALFDNTYVTAEQHDDLELFNNRQQAGFHEFELPLAPITVHALEDDFTLYINDKETDITISEGEQSIGTFPNDNSVSLDIRKDYPWGVVKSEEITIDSDHVNFNKLHALNDEALHALMEQLNETIAQYQIALSERDASLLKDGITENFKEKLEDQITDVEKEDPDYTGKLVHTTYDLSKVSDPKFDENKDAYTLEFYVHHVFHEPNSNLGWLLRDRDEDQYTRSRKLTVIYDENAGEWKLDSNVNEYFIIVDSEAEEFEIAE